MISTSGHSDSAKTILGVDPGLNRTGYAVLETGSSVCLKEGGVIRSTNDQTLSHRVGEIGQGIAELIREFQPTAIAIEQVFSLTINPKSALLLAHARGAILYVASEASVPIIHYTPTQIKRLLTGSGNASKEQMQHAIKHELGLDEIMEPHDVADAVAIALCHFHSSTGLSHLNAATN